MAPTEQVRLTVGEMFDLTGKIALVTGGSRGIGREVALGLASVGADVIVASRRQDACEVVASEIRELGRRSLAAACHVGRWDQIDGLVDRVVGEFGHVDILVNNAGLSPQYPRLSAVSEELWDKVLAVNLKGPFRLSALVGEQMRAAQGGSIINISSIGAVRPSGETAPYCAAKAGLNALTVALADALGPSVRVNSIMPGPFHTDMTSGWDQYAFGQQAKSFPLRRGGHPGEIVGAAIYLASNASTYTTGSCLAVDGGAQWAQPLGGDLLHSSVFGG